MRDNNPFRIDNQFFQKEFLTDDFAEFNVRRMNEICLIRSGTTPTVRDENLKSGVILLKTNDIRNNVLTNSNLESFFYVDEKTDEAMNYTRLQAEDVLMNIVGATTDVIGRASIVARDFPAANITQAMALLRIVDNQFNPYFLFSFLRGKFGNKQVRRIARPTGQYNLNLQEVGSFKIPVVSPAFQTQIENVVKAAHDKLEQSKRLYAEAESLLLAELGLRDWQPTTENTVVKSFKQSFLASGRLDAEFQESKYAELDNLLKSKGAVPLGCVIREEVQRGISPEFVENGEVFVIASKAVRPQGVILDSQECTSKAFYDSTELKKGKLQKNDVLLNGTGRGTLGRAGIYNYDFPAIADNHVTVVRPIEDICNPFYLTLYLNSIVGQMQSERYQSGTSGQLELYPVQIKQFLLYLPTDFQIQIQIMDLITKSFSLRDESKRLLETAKRGVELAIEQDEQTALKWIDDEIHLLR